MSEHLPNPDKQPLTDDELIAAAIEHARGRTDEGRFINDATARMIASQLHGGQTSELYSFTSTGAVSVDLLEEVDREIRNESLSDEVREWADELQQYLIRRHYDGRTDAVEDWNKLWLEKEPELYGRTVAEWHAHLTGDNLDVPASRYGRDASQAAWWAVASMLVYNHFYPGEMDDPEGHAENAMGMSVNNNSSLGPFVLEYLHVLPEEVRKNLDLEGGEE